MARLIQPIELVLDRPRKLLLDNEAVFSAELELGKLWGQRINFVNILADATMGTITMNDVAIILWCALRRDDEALTLAQVRNAYDPERQAEYLLAIYRAWDASTPEPEPATEEQADPLALSSPGNDTGASPVSILASVTTTSGD